ncbi:hypothetical protein SDC9_146533 [bioreactor metagenome]|uniref:Uncharacterized protein n=1 Tax=bioreactor metagenome TaxID=1076179 RepID=A0A645EFH3_9ZZZZ
MLVLEDGRLVGKAGLGIGQVVHAKPCKHRHQCDPRHPDEGGVLRPEGLRLAGLHDGLRITAEHTEDASGDHQRAQELHGRYAEVAQARIHAQCRSLALLGEEEADVGHAGAEVAAAQAAQQRQDQHGGIAGGVVLHRKADADGGDQQRCGGDGGPAAAAEHRHHERVEDAQRGARQRGRGRQPEQLVGRILEAHGGQVDRDGAPDLPDAERQEQRRHRDPQVALGDGLAFALPEGLVLRGPEGQQTALAGRCRKGG